MRLIYLILMCFAAPVAALIAAFRGWRDPTRRERLADRLGRPCLSITRPVLWVHAASMGEVQAGAVLIKRLLVQYPDHQIVVTTQTATGAARVTSLFGEQVQRCYLPYDLPFTVRGFLNRVRPSTAIILETELWPALLGVCRDRQIPVVIASARISSRTAARYSHLRRLFRDVLIDVKVAAQTAVDADRFKALGARNVQVSGNIKFDLDIPASVRVTGSSLRAQFSTRFTWVAGSTHEGEEEAAIEAHRNLLVRQPDALLIVAPRHPQRFDDVRRLLAKSDLPFIARSVCLPPNDQAILLLDTMGELLGFYAACDVAFVGGSLVPVGGHNLLEPAALALPILCGPHLENTRDVADRLIEARALRCVESSAALAESLIELAGEPQTRVAMGKRAEQVVLNNRGAIERTMQQISMRT